MRKLLIFPSVNKSHTRTRPVNHLSTKSLLPNNISIVIFFLIFQKIGLEDVWLINGLRTRSVELRPPIVSRISARVNIVTVRVFFIVWVGTLKSSVWGIRPVGGWVVLVETHSIGCVREELILGGG